LIANAKFSLGRRVLRGNHTVNLFVDEENGNAGGGEFRSEKKSATMISSRYFARHERIGRRERLGKIIKTESAKRRTMRFLTRQFTCDFGRESAGSRGV